MLTFVAYFRARLQAGLAGFQDIELQTGLHRICLDARFDLIGKSGQPKCLCKMPAYLVVEYYISLSEALNVFQDRRTELGQPRQIEVFTECMTATGFADLSLSTCLVLSAPAAGPWPGWLGGFASPFGRNKLAECKDQYWAEQALRRRGFCAGEHLQCFRQLFPQLEWWMVPPQQEAGVCRRTPVEYKQRQASSGMGEPPQ